MDYKEWEERCECVQVRQHNTNKTLNYSADQEKMQSEISNELYYKHEVTKEQRGGFLNKAAISAAKRQLEPQQASLNLRWNTKHPPTDDDVTGSM